MGEPGILLPVTASRVETLNRAANRYAAQIGRLEAYLESRGLTLYDADMYRLGVVTDPEPEHQKVNGWLAIPYLVQGDVVQIRFRCPGGHGGACREHGHGKYMTVAGDSARVYNTGALLGASDTIHVCEGELDTIILSANGYPAVGLPGAESWKPHHARLLAGFDRVYIWADPDEAGRKLAATITARVRRAVTVPLRADVTDTYVAGGRAALDDALIRVAVGDR